MQPFSSINASLTISSIVYQVLRDDLKLRYVVRHEGSQVPLNF